jgi:hypothetical protein
MDLQGFQKRMAERQLAPLAKAVDPEDFTGIVNEISKDGPAVVDHTRDLSAHPPAHNARVEHYRKAISGAMPVMKRTPGSIVGVTSKALYTLPTADNMTSPDKAIVKPYHEHLHPKVKFWQHHPIQGWAEMTNQSLWHAADMGHIHQGVHVSEHAMGPGHDKEPALVIHMEPKTDFVSQLTPAEHSDDMHKDLPKIVAMDFLTNNLDRHSANLLFKAKPPGLSRLRSFLDRTPRPPESRFVAIDHSRSLQYHASNKGAPEFVMDPFHGKMPVPQSERQARETEGKTKDNLLNYANAGAFKAVDEIGSMFGHPSVNTAKGLAGAIASWWPNVKDRVVATLERRLEGLREPRMREHIRKNFNERVQMLDKIAHNPDWYTWLSKPSDLDIPIHVWNRDEDANHNP